MAYVLSNALNQRSCLTSGFMASEGGHVKKKKDFAKIKINFLEGNIFF